MEITIDPASPRAAMACSALIRTLRNACCSRSGSPRTKTAPGLLLLVADEIDACAGERSTAAGHDSRQHALDAQAPANLALGAGKRQQVLDDFRGTVGLAIDSPKLSAEPRRRSRPRVANEQQFEVAEHALQRIVDLVGDPGDELSERGELFGLGELGAQRFPFGFEAGLPRDVARHEDRPDGLAILIDERRHRHDELTAERRMLERAHALARKICF